MSDVQKYRNENVVELGTVEGDLELDNCRSVRPASGNEIVVTGRVRVKGETYFEGSLKAHSLDAKARDTITIDGDLTVKTTAENRRGGLEVTGSAMGESFRAGSSLRIGRNLTCTSASGGGSVKISGNAKGRKVSAGGSVSIEGDAEVERVSAGGSVTVDGRSEIEEFSAGGSGKAHDGKIVKINIGGSFKSTGAIEIEEIDVGGSIKVGPDSKVHSIDVGGTFSSEGDLTFEDIDVGGSIRIGGAGIGRTVDVGGKITTEGPLTLSGNMEVGGKADIGGDFKCEAKIKIGGKIMVDGRIDTYRIIVGGLIDAKYVKADGFRIGRRSEVTCPVEAREILVRERARTRSLYGDEIRIEERSRVGSVYGREVYIERDTVVEGETLYTEKLDAESGVEFREEPRKVDSLPDPQSALF
ncbi:MAG: hypothetical protein ACFFFC_06425 [Candidatus Thorarchaeota archaeon]